MVKKQVCRQTKTVGFLVPLLYTLLACKVIPVSQAAPMPAGVTEETFPTRSSAGNFHYFIAREHICPRVTSVVIAIHGHPRDIGNTLTAVIQAASGDAAASNIPVIAPLFQVSVSEAEHCHSPGLPAALPDDILWNCHSWQEGGADSRGGLSAFAVIDRLVAHLKQRWPALRQVTVAGFSAGGQFVQHYVAFARPPSGVRMRYVIGDPGSWLYFDPRPATENCPTMNNWKYGMNQLPVWLKGDAGAARERYRQADIHYLEGAEDRGQGRGVHYRILDKSCAANSQGTDRLERAFRYARYERDTLQPLIPHQLTVVPGCRHDVRCVFPSPEGKRVLFTP